MLNLIVCASKAGMSKLWPARAFCAARRTATRTQIVHIKEILSIRLEFSRFYSTRFIRYRIFTQPEVIIATFIVTEVDKCNMCGPRSQ